MQPFHPPSSRTRPATPDSPSFIKETQITSDAAARRAQADSDQNLKDYEEKRDRIDKGLEGTMYVAAEVKNWNGHEAMRYPHIRSQAGSSSSSSRPGMSRRTMTFADEPAAHHPVVLSSSPAPRQTLKRSLTLAGGPDVETTPQSVDDDDAFSILRLDVNMGVTRNAYTVISHLETQSIARLLDGRFASCLEHLSALRNRIHDPQSRVLVTGDLNAGKSTLVNSLLRRPEVMPTDQQPLTTRFVEIISAKENGGHEEIHVLYKPGKYDILDPNTYTALPIDKLEAMVTDENSDATSPTLRVFLKEAEDNTSILHNGVVDISLIDAPGLNRDSIKTTANFARQEEIDVVVFVVSAANHFTLSAKDFILQAGHEKAHLFIVVNRFDQIRDKERCRRIVLDQIKQLSPATYAEAADLVHFVDSSQIGLEDGPVDQSFAHLENSLRSFVLVNRAKSKLGPAQTYVIRLLADLELLSSANVLHANAQRDEAKSDLEQVKPVLEKLRKGKEKMEGGLLGVEEKATEEAGRRTRANMGAAMALLEQGQVATSRVELPLYPGLLGVWDYARDCRRVLLASLDLVVARSEQDARRITTDAVKQVTSLADMHLPDHIERSKRVFNPNAMFAARTVASVGLTQQLAEVRISDIFDLEHHLSSASTASSSRDLVPYVPDIAGLGAASLAVGAFTVGGKALGMRSIIEGLIRTSDIVSNPATRRWIGPVLGIATFGAVAYIVYDLPRSVPRNIGRQIQGSLTTEENSIADFQSSRIERETRKVVRIAAFAARETHQAAMSAAAESSKQAQERLQRADASAAFHESVGERVEGLREIIGVKV